MYTAQIIHERKTPIHIKQNPKTLSFYPDFNEIMTWRDSIWVSSHPECQSELVKELRILGLLRCFSVRGTEVCGRRPITGAWNPRILMCSQQAAGWQGDWLIWVLEGLFCQLESWFRRLWCCFHLSKPAVCCHWGFSYLRCLHAWTLPRSSECIMIIMKPVSAVLAQTAYNQAQVACQQAPLSLPHFGQCHATQSPLALWEMSPSLAEHRGTSS